MSFLVDNRLLIWTLELFFLTVIASVAELEIQPVNTEYLVCCLFFSSSAGEPGFSHKCFLT